MKAKRVSVGTQMLFNKIPKYELRQDGWYCMRGKDWEKDNLTRWDLEKSWTSIGYTPVFYKENEFDKLYLRLKS